MTYLREAGVDIIGFLDDNPDLSGADIKGVKVLGGINLLPTLKDKYGVENIYCPIGNNKLRVDILCKANKLGYVTPNFIHESVFISPNVRIGDKGVYILPRTVIMPYTTLDNFVMISVGANIIHHSHLREGVFVSNGVNLGASLTAEKYAYLGMGCTIMTGVKTLGEDCLIGAGAVIIKDVPARAVMAGVPAKVLRIKD